MRLIDADKLINDIQSRISMVCWEAPYDAKWFTRLHDRQREIIGIIENQPTVDAVEVVRCEDCKIHNNCITEDAFKFAGIKNSFCCVGKKVE